jgi:hypothetical protein
MSMSRRLATHATSDDTQRVHPLQGVFSLALFIRFKVYSAWHIVN